MASVGEIKVQINTESLEHQLNIISALLSDLGELLHKAGRRTHEAANKLQNIREAQ